MSLPARRAGAAALFPTGGALINFLGRYWLCVRGVGGGGGVGSEGYVGP